MKHNENNDRFTSDRLNHDPHKPPLENQIFEEVPQQELIYSTKIPSGSDPMGQIHLQGHILRNLARGKHPWWVSLGAGLVFTIYAFSSVFLIFTNWDANHSVKYIKPLVSHQKSLQNTTIISD
jgi:hypothetical protein